MEKRQPIISFACGLPRPRWRGHVHTWAFLMALPAAVVLLFVSNSAVERLGVGVYGLSLAAVFGVSAAYHRLAESERAQIIMRRADHATVFVKIAGTYTPVCLIALPRNWGIPLLMAVWAIAAVGVAVKVFAPRRYLSWASALYLAMGWVALAGLPVIARNLSATAFTLLVVGGVVYSAGAILFWLRRPDPFPSIFGYHEVWHVLTVIAAAAHFGTIVLVTLAA
ncbi:MAG: hemolysin III family protein [Acidimicrobiales bacterium]|nr:hemolysin III family protein [Acidimicrobiales bacterium]